MRLMLWMAIALGNWGTGLAERIYCECNRRLDLVVARPLVWCGVVWCGGGVCVCVCELGSALQSHKWTHAYLTR